MNLIYFGPSEKQLFGAYHPPRGRSVRKEGIVICPSIGTESLRGHRALRQLATMLAKSGYHVLRFDYYGTGDSAGACEDGRMEQWLADISTAIEELEDMANVSGVSLIGLRVGASLAALAATRRGDINRLILWDPVVDGNAYVEERINLDIDYEHSLTHESEVRQRLGQNQTVGIMGFALTRELRDDLSQLDLSRVEGIAAKKVFMLVSREDEPRLRLRDYLKSGSSSFGYQCIESPGEWGEFDELGSLLLPQAMIQGAVACML